MRKPQTLSAEAIVEARRRWEQGEPLERIAKDLNAHATTLRRLKKRDGWTVRVDVREAAQYASSVNRQAQSKVIEEVAQAVIDRAKESGTVESQAAAIVDAFEMSASLIEDYGAGAKLLVADWRSGKVAVPKTQTPADLALTVGAVVARYAALVRESAGRKPGQSTAPEAATNPNAPILLETHCLETIKILVDSTGRCVPGDLFNEAGVLVVREGRLVEPDGSEPEGGRDYTDYLRGDAASPPLLDENGF